jgi:hypothetical protein
VTHLLTHVVVESPKRPAKDREYAATERYTAFVSIESC